MDREVMGIEIGGTKLQVVVGSPDGKVVDRHRANVDVKAGGAGIRAQIERCLPELMRGRDVAAVGIGFGGPVDYQTGRIARSHQIEGWSEFPLGEWMRSLCGKPVAVDNDANVATLAEAIVGAGRNANPVFYVTLGSGVGGGLVVNGSVYHGRKPGESEIGHLRLNREGVIVEQRCSGWAVDRWIRQLVAENPESLLARKVGATRSGEARYLAAAIQEGDALAFSILEQTCEDLAFALSHVAHLVHPQRIVLGGGLSLVGEPFRAGVAQALPRFLMDVFHPGPEIVLAGLSEDAVPVGALLMAGRLS
ncbi:MAG: ROK family protein [Verrucomicrobia bacterium]|nr:ROK family protein [Verrucomicrobiota bacterium]